MTHTRPDQGPRSLTFGSLFAGIGGLDLGLERAGHVCRWQVEIDPFCRRVLAKHWPDVRRYEDVRDVGAHNLEPVDLICGGFPCQDISRAGAKEGIRGERSGLWAEFARIIREMGPKLVLVENVSDLLYRGLGDVLPGGRIGAILHHAGKRWKFTASPESLAPAQPVVPAPAEQRERELTAEQQAAFDEYKRVIAEKVIPEIVEAVKERERLAHLSIEGERERRIGDLVLRSFSYDTWVALVDSAIICGAFGPSTIARLNDVGDLIHEASASTLRGEQHTPAEGREP